MTGGWQTDIQVSRQGREQPGDHESLGADGKDAESWPDERGQRVGAASLRALGIQLLEHRIRPSHDGEPYAGNPGRAKQRSSRRRWGS